jgi:hypothetical protein
MRLWIAGLVGLLAVLGGGRAKGDILTHAQPFSFSDTSSGGVVGQTNVYQTT